MPCDAFEARLLDYDELAASDRHAVDLHTSVCADCREYLETLTTLDMELSRLLADSTLSLDLASSALIGMRASTKRGPTALPELLDFVGWSAVASILLVLAWRWKLPFTFTEPPTMYTLYVGAFLALVAGLWIGLRSWVELRE